MSILAIILIHFLAPIIALKIEKFRNRNTEIYSSDNNAQTNKAIYDTNLRYSYSTPLEKLLIDSFREQKAIILTLKNRKVYVGVSANLPHSDVMNKADIEIIPLISGFRDERDLSFKKHREYEQELDEGSLTPLIICKNEIISIAEWQPNMYTA